MKSLFKFLFILAGIVLLSAFLAPLLHDFLPYKFGRIFNRLIMIFTLVAILALVRFTPQNFLKYGLTWKPDSLRWVAVGFSTGFYVLVLLAILKFSTGMAVWNVQQLSFFQWVLKFTLIFATAFLIGTLEEFFFRGFIFTFFRDKLRWNLILAVLVTSVFYALIHFVGEKKPFIGPDPTFIDGLKLAAAPLMSLMEWKSFWRDAVGLFFFGVILNALVIRTQSLYLSIGLHAGCVFFVKSDGLFVDFLNDHPLLWGSAKMYDSFMGWIFLFLMGALLWRMGKKRLLLFLNLMLVCSSAMAGEIQNDTDVIRSGDRLRIKILPEDDYIKGGSLKVDAEGRVVLPLVGEIEVRGKTPSQAEQELEARIDADYLVDPTVVIEVVVPPRSERH